MSIQTKSCVDTWWRCDPRRKSFHRKRVTVNGVSSISFRRVIVASVLSAPPRPAVPSVTLGNGRLGEQSSTNSQMAIKRPANPHARSRGSALPIVRDNYRINKFTSRRNAYNISTSAKWYRDTVVYHRASYRLLPVTHCPAYVVSSNAFGSYPLWSSMARIAPVFGNRWHFKQMKIPENWKISSVSSRDRVTANNRFLRLLFAWKSDDSTRPLFAESLAPLHLEIISGGVVKEIGNLFKSLRSLRLSRGS